jgi:hypothetical protein
MITRLGVTRLLHLSDYLEGVSPSARDGATNAIMRMVLPRIAMLLCAMSAVAVGHNEAPGAPALVGGRPLVHAHNAYPDGARWRDRITRAMAIRQEPLVIEQDIAYAPRNESHLRSVVSHESALKGSEPTLEEHFFDRIRPIMERALAANQKDRWPVVVLHLDFKSNEREHHRAVWDLLRRHQAWLTTAPADADPMTISQVKPGPLLVLTENGAGQEKDFTEWAAGGSFLLFGSIPGPAVRPSDDPAERARILRRAAPHELVPTSATSYRRWVNFSWAVVEEGGPSRAADWTADEQQRLESVVNYAHQQRLLVRFYTLNGHNAGANRGWSASYNFGSLEAVKQRWRAAISARVDLIATDQYEELAAQMRTASPPASASAQ